MENLELKPEYTESRALIIGINGCKYASPLGYAVNDAQAFAKLLIERFNFMEKNVNLLIDEKSTRDAIMQSYLSFATSDVKTNDRIVIFFAGHGHTKTGQRGEVGFLVPYDGSPANLSTLIRWDEFTRNTELIPAKHILFIMDACYGGLAVTRALPFGSMRFLKDMLLRFTRQVLTAGKADETVADSGGPLPNHSIFTGHLLQALEGHAETTDGIISANSVMSYVYDKVAKDQYSRQTPHYGYLDGDGDFIFKAPNIGTLLAEKKKDLDILVSVTSPETELFPQVSGDLVDTIKEYLSEPKYKIKLHDLIVQKIREILMQLSEDSLNDMKKPFTIEELNRRLEKYESMIQDLQSIIVCLAYWGDEQHHSIMQKIMARISDELGPKDGLVIWTGLRSYPLIILLYSAGIAAVASRKYHTLATLFMTNVSSMRDSLTSNELITAVGKDIKDLERTDVFKRLPGNEKYYTPRSEYLFKMLQPKLDDLLFLGQDYENFFDIFEVFLAIVHADLTFQKYSYTWGPIGRFGWKYSRTSLPGNPFKQFIEEAISKKDKWPPLDAGFFGGDYERFSKVISEYENRISQLHWN